MSTTGTLAVLRATRMTRKCRMCGQPIVLVRVVDWRAWVAFEATASGPKRLAENGVLIEDLPRRERHFCSRKLLAAAGE